MLPFPPVHELPKQKPAVAARMKLPTPPPRYVSILIQLGSVAAGYLMGRMEYRWDTKLGLDAILGIFGLLTAGYIHLVFQAWKRTRLTNSLLFLCLITYPIMLVGWRDSATFRFLHI